MDKSELDIELAPAQAEAGGDVKTNLAEAHTVDKVRHKPRTWKSELTWTGIRTAWNEFWCKEVPSQIWLMYMDLLYIPMYRHEWGRYHNWIPDLQPLRPKTTLEAKRAIRRQTADKTRRVSRGHQPHDWTGCEPITINVSGTVFVTQLRTLKNFPKSLLGNDKKRNRYWNPAGREYFFDRHAKCFEAILHFFQTNGAELNRPQHIPLPIFEAEFRFYEVESKVGIDRLLEDEGYLKQMEGSKPKNLYQRKLCLLFDHPNSSSQARIVALLSVSVVIMSIILFCMETIHQFMLSKEEEDLRDPFFMAETVCMLWFCFEIVIRFTASPSKWKFIRDPMNIVDFVAIIPYFFQVIAFRIREQQSRVDWRSGSDDSDLINEAEPGGSSITFLTGIRLIRVLRIFKLSRHSEGLQILVRTLTASLHELGLLAFFLLVGMILFATAVYYAELSASTFHSIPDAFFYTIVTMTTVGYGEKFPVTLLGRFIGSLCALTGVLTLALPVPVIVANFNYFYHGEADEKYEKHRTEYQHVQHCPWREECETIRAGIKSNKESTGEYLHDHPAIFGMDDSIELGPRKVLL